MLLAKTRTQFILERVKGKVLDVGCSQGRLFIDFKMHSAAKAVLGVDILKRNSSEKQNKMMNLGENELNLFNESFVLADAQRLPFRNCTFDIVVAGELIEHILSPERFVKEAYRILKPKGLLIITTPNRESWINIITKNQSKNPLHISLMNFKELKGMLVAYFRRVEIFEWSALQSDTKWTMHFREHPTVQEVHFWIRHLMDMIVPREYREYFLALAEK